MSTQKIKKQNTVIRYSLTKMVTYIEKYNVRGRRKGRKRKKRRICKKVQVQNQSIFWTKGIPESEYSFYISKVNISHYCKALVMA